ncbi:MAG TPA: VWA domain-containing protein [Pyrinomonadaceae bacterium]|nr:VWA domain-containing protein [Pyrinomonadaceae bacterium]
MTSFSEPSSRAASVRVGARARVSLALLLWAAPLVAWAQQQQQQPAPQASPTRHAAEEVLDVGEDEVVRVDTDLVHVDVSVTDAAGNPVRNLRAEDFKLYEDGEERPISFFNITRRAGQPRPVAVVFALDVSGSMSPEEMARLGGALRAFATRLEAHEAVFAVMSFGTNVKIQQQFTSDPRRLERAAENLARDVGGHSTHAYDAIDDAVRLLVRKAPRTRERRLMKRAVVVVTDGFPVGDTVSPATVIERANAADVSVYTVTLPSFSRLLASASERPPLPTPLDVSGVVEKTGGAAVYATDKDFAPLFKALAEEVTSSYVLSFYPPEEKRRDGRNHTIRVEAPRGLNVRQSRTSYKGEKQ